MGQEILRLNLGIYCDEEEYKTFKKDKETISKILSFIDIYNLNIKREGIIEIINDMEKKIERWIDFNVPKRETHVKSAPDSLQNY